jgi:N-acetylmuramoyl-L-alanine amidase
MSGIVDRYLRGLILCIGLIGTVALPAVARDAPLFEVRLTANSASTEIVLALAQPAAFHVGVEAVGGTAGRITADFASINLIPGAVVSRGIGLIKTYHAEALPGGGVRLVLDLAHPAVITAAHALPAAAGKPARVVIDLAASSGVAMQAASDIPARPEPVQGYLRPSQQDAIASLLQKPEQVAAPHPLKPAKVVAPPLEPVLEPEPKAVPAVAIIEPTPPPRATDKRSIASIISPKRTIVIDAGHGGIDPGAESIAGYHEKEITLATARILRQALEQTGRYNVVMTRDSDVYLKLHERVARARAAHGNLFISLHADSVADAGMQTASARTTRGASIYTLSETASDTESEKYAQRENRADAIGGVDLGDQSDDVAGILVDLTVRETVNDGNRLANMMVDALENQGVGILPTTPHRSAGFAVLKSPDIPSVLIEMGYLSDMSDARALADPRHQQQIARAIVDGVDRYFNWLQVSRS